MTDDIDRLTAQLNRGADRDAAEQLGRELAGLLWSRRDAASEPDELARWDAERSHVRARRRLLATADDELVKTTVQEWGARLRELRR